MPGFNRRPSPFVYSLLLLMRCKKKNNYAQGDPIELILLYGRKHFELLIITQLTGSIRLITLPPRFCRRNHCGLTRKSRNLPSFIAPRRTSGTEKKMIEKNIYFSLKKIYTRKKFTRGTFGCKHNFIDCELK